MTQRPRIEGKSAARTVIHRRRNSIGRWCTAVATAGGLMLLSVPAPAQAATVSASAFCAKISATAVSSIFGEKVTLLGAVPEGANDICEYAKIVDEVTNGVTLNYDAKGTGTPASNEAALKKEPDVTHLTIKPYSPSIGGGTTLSFTDTFTNPTTHASFKESGMVTYNGAKHYGLAVTKVLSTSSLAQLLQFAVNASA